MDIYPRPYVEHNLPLVLLSGLGENEHGRPQDDAPRKQESGARILLESAECQSEMAEQLLNDFETWDGTGKAWNPTALPGPSGSIRYSVKTIGRSYTLPARKAAPLPQSPGADGSIPPRNTELHSPLSPLSPGSPAFPNGLSTPLWFSKHQRQVPCLFLAFFDITEGESASQDERLKSDINTVRSALNRSGYRTRLAVVLISDKSILHAPELEGRIANIRRATALDTKTGLFFMPPMSSQVEISAFVQTIFTALQPSCVEYYRDLSKHARRKKARGGPPPQVNSPIGGASHSTSASGWNVRYEVKQGVFAEFRQEMDIAERHFSAAIEELFSSEGGVLETTNSWSPRWDEARLLCDSTAIRVLRCQLWTGQHTGAAQSWHNYRLRMRDLVDRRGKGSNTYGWEAWESRWACIMSELLEHADLPTLQRSFQNDAGQFSPQQIYALPEKTLAPGERLPPFNFLHHSGYWLRLFANGIRSRWTRALAVPEEDRIPPDRSPASSVANRTKNYDLYLVPDPHEEASSAGSKPYDHAAELGAACMRAAEEFEARRQVRMSEQIRLELANDLVRVNQYTAALDVLVQLWEDSTWRGEDWREPFERLLNLLSRCADQDKTPKNAALILALTWELLSIAHHETLSDLNLTECLDAWNIDERIELRLHDKHRLSPISPTFAFRDRESHVGDSLQCQLVLSYNTHDVSKPIQISRVDIKLGTRVLSIRHNGVKSSEERALQLLEVTEAQEADGDGLHTTANLSLRASQPRILDMSILMREAHLLHIAELTVCIETEKFVLTHKFTEDGILPGDRWFFEKDGHTDSFLLPHLATKTVNVLPKPPKMQVTLNGLRKQYYTDEQVQIVVGIVNDEDEAVHATIVPKVIGSAGETTPYKWADGDEDTPVRSIQDMQAAVSEQATLLIQGPPDAASFVLSLDLRYKLLSDPSTPLGKTVTVELVFGTNFEAKFTFAPRLYPEPWPSYFEPQTCAVDEQPNGIPQLWKLGAQITSVVDKHLEFSELELQVHEVQGDALCNIRKQPTADETRQLEPGGKMLSEFELATQKKSLDDRRQSYLDLSLIVKWARSDPDSPSSTTNYSTTIISVPRLTIPTSEPRVLCTINNDSAPAGAILQYHLENPSTHFLTFALTMEASEDFAFSGPKYRTLSLAPLSRHHVGYQLLLHKEAERAWVSPNLQVLDSYYQKNLRVHPGGKGVRIEPKSGEISVWVGKGDVSG